MMEAFWTGFLVILGFIVGVPVAIATLLLVVFVLLGLFTAIVFALDAIYSAVRR